MLVYVSYATAFMQLNTWSEDLVHNLHYISVDCAMYSCSHQLEPLDDQTLIFCQRQYSSKFRRSHTLLLLLPRSLFRNATMTTAPSPTMTLDAIDAYLITWSAWSPNEDL